MFVAQSTLATRHLAVKEQFGSSRTRSTSLSILSELSQVGNALAAADTFSAALLATISRDSDSRQYLCHIWQMSYPDGKFFQPGGDRGFRETIRLFRKLLLAKYI